PHTEDVLSIFAGLRPLVKSGDESDTAALSRDHSILVRCSGLITLTAGRWTTYRKMAEDVIDQAETLGGLNHKRCQTEEMNIHGWTLVEPPQASLAGYGRDAHMDHLMMTRSQMTFSLAFHIILPRCRW
ncbi:MAG: FAD-dependent oxidoreductase, partial [Kiritimatiellae bacterium]|nr:FAD-dependent oxidoreductase [Kiritimatiellia bacterium]